MMCDTPMFDDERFRPLHNFPIFEKKNSKKYQKLFHNLFKNFQIKSIFFFKKDKIT